MGSRLKEDEKNEKAIRVFLKKDPNRRCINCNSLGPQYVCLTFWTFVCTQCSGIHREFTHRVKSVSMSKFSSQEVANLEKGGNERGRELHFKDWDPQRQPLPDSSNVDRLRDFIKSVYVDQRYSGERPLSRSRGGDREGVYESQRSELRSNYQRDSKSPAHKDRYEDLQSGKPVSKAGYEDHRYEERTGHFDERRTPRQFEAGRDKPDRSYSDNHRYEDKKHYENRGRLQEDRFDKGIGRRFEERFANEQWLSLRNRENRGDSPSSAHSVKEIHVDDVARLQVKGPATQTATGHEMNRSHSLPDARAQRFGSSSSFGSADGNVSVVKMENSGSLIDFLAEPAAPAAIEQSNLLEPTSAVQTLTSVSNNTGWATFDMFSPVAAVTGVSSPRVVPSSADSWLSLVETVSQPLISAGGMEGQSSFSISSAPIPTTLLSAGHVQIVQDLSKANFSTLVPPAVSTTRQEYPESFYLMGAQTAPQLAGGALPAPQHTLLGGIGGLTQMGNYNQSQKSTNPFDLEGDSLTASSAEVFPNMRPLQASLPSLDTSSISVPGNGVSNIGPQWTNMNRMVPQVVSYPSTAPSGGLFTGQHMPSILPQIMKAGPVGPSMGAWSGNSQSIANQGAELVFPLQDNREVGGAPQLFLEKPLELGKGSVISQDSLFLSPAGQHFISHSSLGSLGSISGMSSLLPVQASPQFPAYNSVGPVSNPFA